MLFAFLGYKDQFTQRVAALVDRLCEWRVLRLQGERLADILLHEPEPDTGGASVEAPEQGDIELRGVTFRYAEGDRAVLDNLSLRIPAGQSLVITGASGCGKTTLVKLLLGLHRPASGEILFGGRPLAQIGLDRYRALVGSVMQDDLLFSGSIAENIGFFDPEADLARIMACARLAAVHDDIASMPMAYQTLVGENGGGLSGGQRQRLLLARALYRRPRLLVLDEATSHLDADNEQRVNAALQGLALTRIVVAHRAETIASAQRVVVLDRGRVVRDQDARDYRRCSDPVDEHEQAEPHHVDEVPVPRHRFEGEMPFRREVAAQAAQPDHRQHDGAQRHMETVEAGEHEER
jgi:ATP-binding cassette subfamily B protein RaxB